MLMGRWKLDEFLFGKEVLDRWDMERGNLKKSVGYLSSDERAETNAEYLTKEERRIDNEMKQANTLKCLILGGGDDGVWSAIFGGNERIVSVDDFVGYLVQSGFANSHDEARRDVLPEMKDKSMRYKITGDDLWYSVRIAEVKNEKGRKAYRVSRCIG